MSSFEDEKIDRISHHVESMSKELFQVKKAVLQDKKVKEKLAKKDKKRRNSLNKAQKKFKNVSTNFKIEDFKKIEKRLNELNINASSYIKQLVALDLKSNLVQ